MIVVASKFLKIVNIKWLNEKKLFEFWKLKVLTFIGAQLKKMSSWRHLQPLFWCMDRCRCSKTLTYNNNNVDNNNNHYYYYIKSVVILAVPSRAEFCAANPWRAPFCCLDHIACSKIINLRRMQYGISLQYFMTDLYIPMLWELID